MLYRTPASAHEASSKEQCADIQACFDICILPLEYRCQQESMDDNKLLKVIIRLNLNLQIWKIGK